MEHLSQTCAPATFGLGDQDVLDESYRKAGRLDAGDFSVKLDLSRSGLLDIVCAQLLEGKAAQKYIYGELYKLNVYGMWTLPIRCDAEYLSQLLVRRRLVL